MKNRKAFLLIVLAVFCLITQLPSSLHAANVSIERVYVDPSQIQILANGIFFINEQGEVQEALGVFFDESGLYVAAKYYQCPGCDRWNDNNICKNPACPLYNK